MIDDWLILVNSCHYIIETQTDDLALSASRLLAAISPYSPKWQSAYAQWEGRRHE